MQTPHVAILFPRMFPPAVSSKLLSQKDPECLPSKKGKKKETGGVCPMHVFVTPRNRTPRERGLGALKRKRSWLVAWDVWKRGEVQKGSDEKKLCRLTGQELHGLQTRKNLWIRRKLETIAALFSSQMAPASLGIFQLSAFLENFSQSGLDRKRPYWLTVSKGTNVIWTWARFDPATQRRGCFLITVSGGDAFRDPQRNAWNRRSYWTPTYALFFPIHTPHDKVWLTN